MKGILNLYKPKGITSSDAVLKVRKALSTRAVGHMGTLDPAGEGVLLIGVGKATRLFDFFLGKDKTYEAIFTFGYETDTLDGDGTVLKEGGRIPSESEIRQVIPELVGPILQYPPRYSAKSINGVRAYRLAREGKDFALSAASVTVHSLELLGSVSPSAYKFTIHCSAGTYIRSICRDMAALLGTFATMTAIKRLSCGHFRVEDSVTLAQLEECKENCLVSVEQALRGLPTVILPDAFHRQLVNGCKIPYEGDEKAFVLQCKGELFGIASSRNGILKIDTYLRD